VTEPPGAKCTCREGPNLPAALGSGTGSRIRFPLCEGVGYAKNQKRAALGYRRDQITLDTTVVPVLTDFGEGWVMGGGITCILGARRTVDLELLPG